METRYTIDMDHKRQPKEKKNIVCKSRTTSNDRAYVEDPYGNLSSPTLLRAILLDIFHVINVFEIRVLLHVDHGLKDFLRISITIVQEHKILIGRIQSRVRYLTTWFHDGAG